MPENVMPSTENREVIALAIAWDIVRVANNPNDGYIEFDQRVKRDAEAVYRVKNIILNGKEPPKE
jgi:hypothetical protein